MTPDENAARHGDKTMREPEVHDFILRFGSNRTASLMKFGMTLGIIAGALLTAVTVVTQGLGAVEAAAGVSVVSVLALIFERVVKPAQ